MRKRLLGIFVVSLISAAGAAGLAQDDRGPKIIFDSSKRPFPDVPFPNDVFTIKDPDSPTGLRVFIPAQGKTKTEALGKEIFEDACLEAGNCPE